MRARKQVPFVRRVFDRISMAVGSIGLKGKACIFMNPARHAISSVALKSSCVSPGKPTMTSVVKAGLSMVLVRRSAVAANCCGVY